MNVCAINIARLQQIEFSGELVDTGIFKQPVEGVVDISLSGVAGDVIADASVHGGPDQAVYLYSSEDYQWWEQQLGKALPAGIFGENLTTEGLDVTALTIGDRLVFDTLVLEITAPRTPCFKLATRMEDPTFAKKFVKAARPGAYARVITPGKISAGDHFSLQSTEQDFATTADVFEIWHAKQRSRELMRKILDSPVSLIHKLTVQQWYSAAESGASD